MLRFLLTVAVVGGILYLASGLTLGQRTLGEHARRIWSTKEAQELREDLKKEEARARKKLKTKLETKLDELRRKADGGPAPRSSDAGAASPTASRPE